MSDNESNNTRAAKFVGDVALKAITTAQSALAREVLAEIHGQGTLDNTGLCDLRYVTRRLRDLFTRLGVKIEGDEK